MNRCRNSSLKLILFRDPKMTNEAKKSKSSKKMNKEDEGKDIACKKDEEKTRKGMWMILKTKCML